MNVFLQTLIFVFINYGTEAAALILLITDYEKYRIFRFYIFLYKVLLSEILHVF